MGGDEYRTVNAERREPNGEPGPAMAGDAFGIHPALEVVQDGETYTLVWRDSHGKETHVARATDADLLALKVVSEDMPLDVAADACGLTVGRLESVLYAAAERGILVAPPSRLRREADGYRVAPGAPERLLTVRVFVVQWHITHACDLHCLHCYDRSNRAAPSREQAMAVLEDLCAFCRERHVRGRVCFTGGNPFLYPNFVDAYRAAWEHGFAASILGNPVSRRRVEEILDIQRPGCFQVSLEGLPEHNDAIRGEGHFASVMAFLDVLRDLGIASTVMLTLTQDNIDQVLPLGERLRGRTDRFLFNRLSPVGEGATLALPTGEEYARFLDRYIAAAADNPVLGFKDNLFGPARRRLGAEPRGGCTGFGCGAAFNFVAILPDGEVHACRKFSSPIGNVHHQSLAEIYDSEPARRYRRGSSACAECDLRSHCGGCYAVTRSTGSDIFTTRDPHCPLPS
jgi:selenobiotic family peptide radical SAM maturase